MCEGINKITGISLRNTCGVCNSMEIQINSLPRIYPALCIDGITSLSGLDSSYGLSGIPFGLIKEIKITKGPYNSKINNEGISGTFDFL